MGAKYSRYFHSAQENSYFILYALFLVVYIFFDSKIPWNDGLGFDGLTYSKYSSCLPGCWSSIDSYHVNRLFVPFATGLIFNILNIQFTSANIQSFYSLIDCLALVSCYYLCSQVLARTNCKKYEFLLFVGFIAYPLLKGVAFYPVLGDYVAVFFFTAAYYYSSQRNYIALFVVTVMGYFSHALILPLAIALFSFDSAKTWTLSRIQFVLLKTFLLGLLTAGVLCFIIFNIFHSPPDYKAIFDLRVVVFALPLSLFFAYWVFSRFFEHICTSSEDERCLIPALNLPIFGQLFCTYIVLNYIKSFFPSTFIDGSQVTWFIYHLLYNSAEKPFAFLASNFLFFGPLYILLLVSFLLVRSQRLLTPFRAMTLLSFLLLSMRPESRTVMFMWPVVVILFIQSYGHIVLKYRTMSWVVFFVALVFSQALFPTFLLNKINSDLVSILYFSIQGGYESIGAWSLAIGVVAVLLFMFCIVMRREIVFRGIPRIIVAALAFYCVLIISIVYICSFSSLAGPMRSVLSLVDRDFLSMDDPSLVSYKNMGDIEHDASNRWIWGFGPTSSVHFISYSKESLTLFLEVSTTMSGQVISISINNARAVNVDLDSLKKHPEDKSEKIVLKYDFIPHAGINSIDFSYLKYYGKDVEMTPGDDRKFAVMFTKIALKASVPESYVYTFPYYFFMFGSPWPLKWYASSPILTEKP